MPNKLIIALDFNNRNEALTLIDKLDPAFCALKVGSEMFTLFGSTFIKQLINKQFKLFLDLKFFDIPNTVARACKACADLGVWMINVHAMGGINMMCAAREAIESFGANRPLLVAVTVLTSFDQDELACIGVNHSLQNQVSLLAKLTKDSGLDGVVSSALEVKLIKEKCGAEFIAVTPGIRLPENKQDDQNRIVTPHQAISQGSDYLVIGRPVTQALDPAAVVQKILLDIY